MRKENENVYLINLREHLLSASLFDPPRLGAIFSLTLGNRWSAVVKLLLCTLEYLISNSNLQFSTEFTKLGFSVVGINSK